MAERGGRGDERFDGADAAVEWDGRQGGVNLGFAFGGGGPEEAGGDGAGDRGERWDAPGMGACSCCHDIVSPK